MIADTAINGGGSAPAFSQGTKQSDSVGAPGKIEETQWEVRVACDDPVLVISKYDEACFAAKKTWNDDPRAQLERDLASLTIMQLRASIRARRPATGT